MEQNRLELLKQAAIKSGYRFEVSPDGTVEQERIPQQFRVRRNGGYCLGCQQIVDDIDDAERVGSTP